MPPATSSLAKLISILSCEEATPVPLEPMVVPLLAPPWPPAALELLDPLPPPPHEAANDATSVPEASRAGRMKRCRELFRMGSPCWMALTVLASAMQPFILHH